MPAKKKPSTTKKTPRAPRTDITADMLRKWLEKGRDVTLLDVRPSAERAGWYIPGSRHVDADRALRDGEPEALAGLDLPADATIVTICADGVAGGVAQKELEALGCKAMTLVGGMKAWSTAWNRAEVDLPEGDRTRVIQMRRTGKGCLSYLVGSEGIAVIIDPSLEPEAYASVAKECGWKIMATLETHVHNDHLTRARRIAAVTGATVAMPDTTRVTFPYHALRDSDPIQVGAAVLTTMRTPGHSPESVCYRLNNRLIFTGDTLYTAAVGRPDLEPDDKAAKSRAGALYRSLKHVVSLPGQLRVLPGHTAHPVAFDGIPIADTLDTILERVDVLGLDEPAFVAAVLSSMEPLPLNRALMQQHNEAGTTPDGDPRDLEAGPDA